MHIPHFHCVWTPFLLVCNVLILKTQIIIINCVYVSKLTCFFLRKEDMFPDMNTPNMLFGGVKFLDVPICHIKSSRNNTILQVTKPNGKFLYSSDV